MGDRLHRCVEYAWVGVKTSDSERCPNRGDPKPGEAFYRCALHTQITCGKENRHQWMPIGPFGAATGAWCPNCDAVRELP